jgi:hypothetical protein
MLRRIADALDTATDVHLASSTDTTALRALAAALGEITEKDYFSLTSAADILESDGHAAYASRVSETANKLASLLPPSEPPARRAGDDGVSGEALGQIDGPTFCAGVVVVNRVIVDAAPYLKNRRLNMVGWTVEQVRDYCAARGWRFYRVHTPAPPT